MDSTEVFKTMLDKITEGQNSLREEMGGIRQEIVETKHGVVRLEERVDHLRERLRQTDDLEDRVRVLEDERQRSKGRDRIFTFGLGAIGALITLAWNDIINFFKGVG